MFTLLNGLYQIYTSREEYFVIIIGLDNAGKTTLLEKIKAIYTGKGLKPEQIGPTVGLNVGKIEIDSIRINFWDLGGQKELQSLWTKYYDEAHGIVFVVDSSDQERLEQVKKTLDQVIQSKEIEGIPILMLANKQDVPGALKLHEIQSTFNQIALHLEARDSKVLAVSALRGDGVQDAVEWLSSRIQLNKETRPPVIKSV